MQRVVYIDAAKGVSIVSIVLLHFENGLFPPQVNLIISTYMITMFYITTGWLSVFYDAKYSFREFARRRWRQLMVPYFWWTIIILVFECILCFFHYYDNLLIARDIYKSITLRGIGTLWFLPALFGGNLLWFYSRNVNKWYVYVLIIIVSLVYQYAYHNIIATRTDNIGRLIDSPFRVINVIVYAWMGIGAGYIASKVQKIYQNHIHYTFNVLIGLLLCVISYVIETNFSWTLPAFLLSPIGVLMIIKSILPLSYVSHVLYPFTYLGRHSMVLMVTHYSIILVLCQIINGLITGSEELTGWLSICWFIIAMAAEYPLIVMIEKKAPKIIGKK